MSALDLKLLERAAKLMAKYQLDEVACEAFTLRRSNHMRVLKLPGSKQQPPPTEDSTFLDAYTAPELPEEPWNNIPDEAVERFAVNGKLT